MGERCASSPFPGPGGRFQISVGGGVVPTWDATSRRLYYIRGGCCMMAATIAGDRDLRMARRDSLVPVHGASHPLLQTRTSYDVTPDGRFVIARLNSAVSAPVLVFGWADDVPAKMEGTRH